MRLQRTDTPLFVAEDDEFLAEQLYFLRKIAKLIRRADRLPIAAQQFAHRAPRLDACQLIIRWRCLASVC